MKYVVDASVAVKWVVTEDDTLVAMQLVTSGDELIAPDFVMIETANILWKKVRRKQIDTIQATTALTTVRLPFSRFVASAGLLERAVAIAFKLDHPVYDCLYLALADSEDAVLITADHRLVAVAAGSDFKARVALLGFNE